MGDNVTVDQPSGLYRSTNLTEAKIGFVTRGEVVEILSGPHSDHGNPLYRVKTANGTVGFFPVMASELGHAHGPVVPVPTEASAPVPAPVVDAVVEYDQAHAINVPEAKNDELRAMYDPLKRANATLERTNQELQAALNKLGCEYAELQARNDANAGEYQRVKTERDILRTVAAGRTSDLLNMRTARDAARALADERLKLLDADALEKNRLRDERDDAIKTVLNREREILSVENDRKEAYAEANRLRKLITPDYLEWKAQEEQRVMTANNTLTDPAAKPGNVVLTPVNGGEVVVNGNVRVEGRVAQAMHPIVKTLKTDGEDALWRLAGSQFVKTTRAPLVGLLTRHLAPDGDDALCARIAAFLETELGGAMLSALLSVGLSSLPATVGTEVPQRLAREFRVRAMAGGAEAVAEVLMAPLREVMTTYLKDVAPMLPTAPPTLGEGTGIRPEVVDAEHATVAK